MEESISIERMLEIQEELYQKYGADWIPKTPENGHYSLLWAMGEMGEIVDIIKNRGHAKIMNDASVRHDFVKELVDVMMYMSDLMTCFEISAEEFSKVYEEKHAFNMKRW